ncbi:serine/threonine protein kinase [Candidatus Acidianus copahuensis]|uniref:non-specific serine/threonine protein kinase n=1 Tax=Candidatus Acidianus copahuensis TaxID=1160895 RepID=A0A031LNK1_9CREN|nr:Kae1-associated kinase Bud32 [Candidatus Acidianus copahuensis]EZQ03129.1 serine/threonine protein kinase [Candidatus Acidianus copahuensis]
MEELKLISRGAESFIYETYFLGIHAILKKRISKQYRESTLDERINRERTIHEAKIMYDAMRAGVPVPAVLYINLEQKELIIEYIEGESLLEYLKRRNEMEDKFMEELGIIVSRLHRNKIVHGDLTTNNVMVSNNRLFVIDFGLSKRSDDVEDIATDIHVFLRSLESIHPEKKEKLYSAFLKGYMALPNFNEVLSTVKEIRMRGRYIEERRNKGSNK